MEDKKNIPPALVDREARSEAINNLNENLWVEAGAGTGKTTLLIDRLLHIITSGAARLDQVVAITFTEKAAAELRARLREKLEELAVILEPEQAGKVYRALDDIEIAPISTIHSFATALLRERPVEAGVDPRFVVADSEETDDLLNQVWEQWLSAQLQKETAVLKKALSYGCKIGQLSGLGKMLYRNRDLVAEGKMPGITGPDITVFLDRLTSAKNELSSLLPHCIDEADRGYQYLKVLEQQAEILLNLSGREEQERYILQYLKKISVHGNQANWDPRESCRRQKDICRELAANLAEIRLNITAGLVAELVCWSRDGYLVAVEKVKQEQGILDFQDLLLKARNLLRDCLPVRSYFQRRFRYLLVDEFQDTDPLQVDLVFLLAEKKALAEHWQEVEPEAGKLFLVGDPKQSIYRFRRADIEIYQGAKTRVLEEGRLLNITQNFRTVPRLIDWVNYSFNKIIQPQENFQPDYQVLSAYRSDPGQPALVVPEPAGTLEDASVDEVRAAEAEAAAELINRAVGNWTVTGSDDNKRTLSFGDLALLFPATTGIEYYEEALRRHGIPYRLEGGKKFYQRPEIIALKNLLNAVANPHDRIALIAVLRYWGGISDENLYLFRHLGGEFNIFVDPGRDFPDIAATMALLKNAHQDRHSYTLSALVEKLLKDTWFWQRTVLEPRSLQALANLRKVIQLLRAREQSQPLTLKGFTHWLDQAWSEDRAEEESLLHDPGGDAVQLLTIHRAKGLEFPAVFLLNAGGGKKVNEPFIADRGGGKYYLNLGGDLASSGYREALDKEKLRLEAERIRLFYVAATRARDYFVLPRFHNKKSPGYWSYLEKVDSGDPGKWPGCKIIGMTGEYEKEPLRGVTGKAIKIEPAQLLQQRTALLADLSRIFTEASVPAPFYSAGELIEPGQRPDERELLLQQDEEAQTGQGSGISMGSAFHQVMEQIDICSTEPSDLEALIAEASNYWAIPDQAQLTGIVAATLQHPLLERVRAASEYQREVPFVFNLDGKLIEGIVDLLFIEEGSMVIVDYKTDDVPGRHLEERWQRYKRQGQIYALALNEITGFPVKEIAFYFVRQNKVKTITAPDLVQIKDEITAIVNNKQLKL